MSSLLNRTQNQAQFHASTDFGVWLEIRAELEQSFAKQNYNENIGHTVEKCQGMLKKTSTVLILCYLEKSCQFCEDFKIGSVDLNR